MSSTVSYANVAAKGTNQPNEKDVDVANVQPDIEGNTTEGAPTTESNEEASSSQSEGENVTEATVSNGSNKKEKKSLAPAPVPTKSAWGSSSGTSTEAGSVDEHKWPTPDKVTKLETQFNNKGSQQKFIKPITNKWVPISAKVVLPNPRNNNQKQNRNRKAKKQNNQTQQSNQKKQNTSPSSNGQAQQIIEKKHIDDERSQDFIGGHIMEPQQVDVHDSSAVQFEGDLQQNYNDQFSQQYQQQFGQNNFRPRFNSNGTAQPQKNFRRFANGNGSGPQQYKQRFNNNQQSQNGFYHPQPYIQNQNLQNFNNRQFRPQSQNNRNFRHQNGFHNGAIGLSQVPQVQIPPPISPKQNPQQALTQQIDYYFSLENLIRDVYLRKNMDTNGWVGLPLILNFKRVKIIINGIQNSIENKEIDSNAIILESIKICENLEIKYINDKKEEDLTVDDVQLRVKGNFEQWLLPAESTN